MKELYPLQRLRELYAEALEKRGYKLTGFLVSPDEHPRLNVIIELPDEAFQDDEEKQVNATIAEIEEQMKLDELEAKRAEKAVDAVNELNDLYKRLGDPDEGILGAD